MRLLVYTAPTPAEDLALEEAIQLGIEEGSSPSTWRLWQPTTPAVILGTGQEHAKEVALDVARAEGVPVLRRHSGGGAVLIGPGALNYSGFFRYADLPGSETITGAMCAGLKQILSLVKTLGVEAELAGLSDVVVKTGELKKKIAGNAQARKRHSVVVHGTLLVDPNWEQLARLLTFPSKPADYRAGRSHREFLTSMKELGSNVSLDAFADTLARELKTGPAIRAPLASELERAQALLAEKYARDDWNLRR